MSRSTWREQPPLDPAVRRSFLDARRGSHMERMDAVHAPTYDRNWGAISPTHEAFVRIFLDLTRAGGTVLDAACGTGKYWALVLGSGRTVVGVDQSAGILRVAKEKHPGVHVERVSLHELRFHEAFDAVMCVDALENVGPEDWPTALARLRDAGRPGSPLYVTVELADEDELRRIYEKARAAGHPVVPGEDFDGIGYHYYPTPTAVRGWLEAAGLDRVDDRATDEYHHYLLRKPAATVP